MFLTDSVLKTNTWTYKDLNDLNRETTIARFY